MSRFNLPVCENQSIDNYVNSEKSLNLSDLKDLRTYSNMPQFNSLSGHSMGNNIFMEPCNLKPRDIYKIPMDDSDIKKTYLNIENKKLMKNIQDDENTKVIATVNENMQEQRFESKSCLPDLIDCNEIESIPLVDIKKNKNNNIIKNSTISVEQYQDLYPPNKKPLSIFIGDGQDVSNISSIPTVYSVVNGKHVSRIKNTCSSGTSFMNNPTPQVMYSTPFSRPIDINDLHNLPKQIKSQNIHFSQLHDMSEPKPEEDFSNSMTSKNLNFRKDMNMKVADINKMPISNSTQILIPCPPGHKEAILIQQPECYEPELYPSMAEMCLENIGNHSTGEVINAPTNLVREKYIPVDYIYPNNYYGPTFPISESRKNIPYLTPQMPIQFIPIPGPVVLNSNVNPNFINVSPYPHYCLTPIPQSYLAYSTDKSKHRCPVQSESKEKPIQFIHSSEVLSSKPEPISDSHSFFTPESLKSLQNFPQVSSHCEINHISSYGTVTTHESVTSKVIEQNSISQTSNQNVVINDYSKTNEVKEDSDLLISNKNVPGENCAGQKVGKFMVTSVQLNNDSAVVQKSTENLNDIVNDIPKQDRPQQNSRFKKTRIRETVERWRMDSINTYDCRFKIIPSKIMSLYESKSEYLSDEMDRNQSCAKCETHDKEKYCYDADYHKKEFKFWHNGNHIDLCTEIEEEVENYCQFHAKILKLLNQNQNLSLSKYSNHSFDFSENPNYTTPRIFQTVLISSPENENYIINVDAQASNVLLSAPPVSPSVMNTASITSLPTNIHSPRSAATMVMLKHATPVMFSSATRNTNLLNESISIEKINHSTSVNMGMEADTNGHSGQQILANNENSPLKEMWQSSPIKSDQMAFKLSSPTFVTGTVIAENHPTMEREIFSNQHSLYSIGHMSPIYYPIYQQPLPSISSTMITNKCHESFLSNIDEYNVPDSLPSDVVEEINKSANSFKSIITNLFQTEHSKLLNEIKALRKSNEQLSNELLKMKRRSEKLEHLLRRKRSFSNNVTCSDQNPEFFDQLMDLNNSNCSSPELERSEIDYRNLV